MNNSQSSSSHIETIEASWNQLLEALSETTEEFRGSEDAPDLAGRLETLYESVRGLGSAWGDIRRRFPEDPAAETGELTADEQPLPGKAYHKALTQALDRLGGEARPITAIREVERIMGSRIRPIDRERFERSGQVIFENRIRFARNDLKINGLIDPHSSHGVWRLTEAGVNFARSSREEIPAPVTPDLPGQITFF